MRPPTTPWGITLERLRLIRDQERKAVNKEDGFSPFQLSKDAGITQPEYRRTLDQEKNGPTIRVVERLLDTMKFSWLDWAKAYEEVRRSLPDHSGVEPKAKTGPLEKVKPLKRGQAR